jgi:hypothetical protein
MLRPGYLPRRGAIIQYTVPFHLERDVSFLTVASMDGLKAAPA